MGSQDILRGNFDSLFEQRSKAVKIFLSSTFSDTHTERDYLIKNIYPKLREYCQKTHGLDFQVYDMRWGISHEITTSHMTTTVCLNEIKNCQNSSVGPNFVAFLSHRYGSRSLPTRIKANEYEVLRKELNSSDDYDRKFSFEDKDYNLQIENMFEICYELDDNETPARYRLRHIDKIIQNYKENNSTLNRAWSKLEKKLGNLFRAVADSCLEKNLITPVEHERYFVSVTEKEIFNGILRAKNVERNALYFEREIEDLDEKIDQNVNMAKRFTELDNNNCVDSEVRNLLDNLKKEKIPSKLPETNMFKFKVKWDTNGISLDTHREYIEKFGKTFYEKVKNLIDLNQEEQKKNDDLTHDEHELIQEVIDHASFCKETVSKFHGRADILHEIQNYLLDYNNNMPFILYGYSGCGKTAVLAKITSQIFKIVPDPENYSVLLRFLGTTPISSDILKTFLSLMRQLCRIFNIKEANFKTRNELEAKQEFENLLNVISKKCPNKKIVIVLDSIDQLNSIYYKLEWFFAKLNKNVKIIYSTLPRHGNILDILKKRMPEENFKEIKSLDPKLAEDIILDWLSKIERRINDKQKSVLRELFSKATLYPLYVKLIFDIVTKWTSFFEPDQKFKKCLDIDESIQYIFLSLEKIHGKLLFSRAIIYMSLFKNGISENEIEDILSLDDDVLYDIFEFHAPPIRKLPIALWARIKNDLKGYMVEKEVDDTRVIYWYHRRFIEVANKYYISNLFDKERSSIFSNVIDFFNETWKHKPKPYRYNEYLAKKFGLKDRKSKETRETGIQATMFVDQNGTIRYNKRKINELPDFISKLTPNVSLPLICELVLFDLNFLSGLFYYLSFKEIFDLIDPFLSISSYAMTRDAKNAINELTIFEFSLLQCGVLMKDNFESLMIYFLSRTLNFYNYLKYFTRLIDQYYTQAPNLYPLVLIHQYLDPPMGQFLFELDKHKRPISHFIIGGDQNRFVLTLSNTIYCFDILSLHDLGEIKICNFNQEIIFFLSYLDNFSQNYDVLKELNGGIILCSNNQLKLLNFDSTTKFSLKSSIKKILCAYVLTKEHLVVVFEDSLEVFDLESDKKMDSINFDHKISIIRTNYPSNKIYDLSEKNELLFLVCFENFQVLSFSIAISEKKIVQEIKRNIPAYNMKIVSMDIFQQSSYSVLLTFDRFSFCIFDFFNDKLYFYQNESKDTTLKLVDNDNGQKYLFLGSNKSLFLLDEEDRMFEITGNFSNGSLSQSREIIGIQEGKIIVYTTFFDSKRNKMRIIKLSTFKAHDEQITSFFVNDRIILTASKDSLFRAFFIKLSVDFSEFQIDFQKSQKEIKKLISLNEENLFALMHETNELCVWNKINAKIEFNLFLDTFEIIAEILCSQSKSIVVSKLDEQTFRIRCFLIEINKNIYLKEKMRRDFTNVDHIKIEYDTKRDDLFVITISNKKVNIISYNLNEINPTISNQNVDLSQLLVESHHLNINQFTILFNKKLLVFTQEQSLYYFDTTSGKLLNSKSFREQSMNIDYFLNPSSMSLCYFKNLAPVENSDSLILLDNIGNIYFVNYLVETNEIRSFRSKDFIFDSFKINKDKLVACDLVNFKLVCFDLAKAEQSLSFRGSFFAIDFEKSKNIQHYGLGTLNKNVYLIENKKNLRFFDLINGDKLRVKQTANLVLYAEATSVLCSDEFISLSMKDKKVISFLISDKENLEKTRQRIKNLPIFGVPDSELVRKNQLMVDYCVNSLDSDSDDSDIDPELYFDERSKFSNAKDKKIKKRFEQNSILVEATRLECKNMNCLNLKNNWQEDISKKNFIISKEKLTYEEEEEEDLSITESDLHHKDSLLKILKENSDKSSIKNNKFNTSIANNFSSTACMIQ